MNRSLANTRKKFVIQRLPFLVVVLFAGFAENFNLENRNPIRKIGKTGSFFGYSVAEHRISNSSILADSWILVGAPLGKNLQPGTNRSGALFKCPLTADPYDCSQVPTDGRRYVHNSSLSKPLPDEIKENQWLGATVRSQGSGGKVLVCAHRYVHKVHGSRWGQGLCYVLTNDLEYDQAYEPCKGFSTAYGHEEFGFCQAGTNGLLLPDGTAIIGTPGPYNWRGTIFVIKVSGDYLTRDKNFYRTPLDQSPNPVDKNSYLGMSVAAGNFMDATVISFAAGAPRSNDTGQVVIFEKRSPHLIMNVLVTLDGEQLASSFGYELTSADLNNDGLADLIVGAPFYFTRAAGGAVYVYMNENNPKCYLTCNRPLKLTGKPESRFGFSIANLGDLNRDTYDDIAIGAPYENGGGAVYIYLGAKRGLSTRPSQILYPETSDIRTLGYSLSAGLDMDLNGYPDLLIGAFESDSVFLYRSRPIIDITTRINQDYLRNIDVNRKGCHGDRFSNFTCFKVDMCFELKWHSTPKTAESPNAAAALPETFLFAKIEAETYQQNKKYSRVFFKKHTNNDYSHNIQKRIIQLQANLLKYCFHEVVYVKSTVKDILSPIKFHLNYTLGENELNSPILNQDQASQIFSATFQKDCGTNDVCETNLAVKSTLLLPKINESNYILNMVEQDELKLDVSVQNYGESAYEAQLFIEHSNALDYIALDDKNSNTTCNLWNQTIIVCNLGNPFKSSNRIQVRLRFEFKYQFDDFNKNSNSIVFKVYANSTSKELDIEDNSVELRTQVVKRAEVFLHRSENLYVYYGGEVKGESAMEYLDEIGSQVIHIYQVVNEGPWKVDSLTVEINWPFQVTNTKEIGKWLLYLEEAPRIDHSSGAICNCYWNNLLVNPLSLKKRPGYNDEIVANLVMEKLYQSKEIQMAYRRSKREPEFIVRSEQIVDNGGHRRKIVDLNCLAGTAKCTKITCNIQNLGKGKEATISIKSRIWNSTLIEDYPNVDWVRIVSDAKIIIPDDLSILQNVEDDYASIETIALPDLDQNNLNSVPAWIIIAAIVTGLVLLIMLTWCLYKLGFFKRKRIKQKISGQLKKKSKEETPFLS